MKYPEYYIIFLTLLLCLVSGSPGDDIGIWENVGADSSYVTSIHNFLDMFPKFKEFELDLTLLFTRMYDFLRNDPYITYKVIAYIDYFDIISQQHVFAFLNYIFKIIPDTIAINAGFLAPDDKPIQAKFRVFLKNLTPNAKQYLRLSLINVAPEQWSNVLNSLINSKQDIMGQPVQIQLSPDQLYKEVVFSKFQNKKNGLQPVVTAEMFPNNTNIQKKVENLISNLVPFSKELLYLILLNRSLEEQGRVLHYLSRFADNAQEMGENVYLDINTVLKVVRLVKMNLDKSDEDENIKMYPNEPEKQHKINLLYTYLTTYSKHLIHLYFGDLTFDEQGHVLLYLYKIHNNAIGKKMKIVIDAHILKKAIRIIENHPQEDEIEEVPFDIRQLFYDFPEVEDSVEWLWLQFTPEAQQFILQELVAVIPFKQRKVILKLLELGTPFGGKPDVRFAVDNETLKAIIELFKSDKPKSDIENLFLDKPEDSKRVNAFWKRLTKPTQKAAWHFLNTLSEDEKLVAILKLSELNKFSMNQTDEKLVLDLDIIEAVTTNAKGNSFKEKLPIETSMLFYATPKRLRIVQEFWKRLTTEAQETVWICLLGLTYEEQRKLIFELIKLNESKMRKPGGRINVDLDIIEKLTKIEEQSAAADFLIEVRLLFSHSQKTQQYEKFWKRLSLTSQRTILLRLQKLLPSVREQLIVKLIQHCNPLLEKKGVQIDLSPETVEKVEFTPSHKAMGSSRFWGFLPSFYKEKEYDPEQGKHKVANAIGKLGQELLTENNLQTSTEPSLEYNEDRTNINQYVDGNPKLREILEQYANSLNLSSQMMLNLLPPVGILSTYVQEKLFVFLNNTKSNVENAVSDIIMLITETKDSLASRFN